MLLEGANETQKGAGASRGGQRSSRYDSDAIRQQVYADAHNTHMRWQNPADEYTAISLRNDAGPVCTNHHPLLLFASLDLRAEVLTMRTDRPGAAKTDIITDCICSAMAIQP